MKGITRLFHRKGDPWDLIPNDAPWYRAWGYQGILVLIYFRYLESIIENEDDDTDSAVIKNYEEKLESARFACSYGRTANKSLRLFAARIDALNITARDNLKTLINTRTVNSRKDGKLSITSTTPTVIFGVIYILFNVFLSIYLTHIIIDADTTTITKITRLLHMASFTILPAIGSYILLIKPHLILHEIKPVLTRQIIITNNKHKPHNAAELQNAF